MPLKGKECALFLFVSLPKVWHVVMVSLGSCGQTKKLQTRRQKELEFPIPILDSLSQPWVL